MIQTITLIPASDRIRGKGRWNENDADIRFGLFHGIFNRIENRTIKMGLTTLSGGHPTNDVGAVFDHLLCVEGSFLSGETLYDDLGIFID